MAKIVNCHKCTAHIIPEDAVQCGTCKGSFHFECALVREVQFRKKSATDKAQWMCVQCKSEKGRVQSESASQASPKTMDDVFRVLSSIQNSLVNLETRMNEVCDSQQFLSDKYDELMIQVQKVPTLEAALLESETQVQELQQRLNLMEQYSRRNHLEIGNIPQEKDEKVDEIVINVGSKLGLTIHKEDIAAAHRLRSAPGKTPSIIVEFVNRRLRNKYYENRKLLPQSRNRIFINESLCSYFKNLLRCTKDRCKEENYKYCWYRNNKIFARRTDGCRPIVVTRMEDLIKIKKSSEEEVTGYAKN